MNIFQSDSNPLIYNLERLRRQSSGEGMSQKELSFISGVCERNIQRAEKKKRLSPELTELACMAAALDTTIDGLICNGLMHEITRTVNERKEGRRKFFRG